MWPAHFATLPLLHREPIKTHPTFTYRPESTGEGLNQHPNKALDPPSDGCHWSVGFCVSSLPVKTVSCFGCFGSSPPFWHEELLAEYEVRVKAVYQRYNPDAPSETRMLWMTDHETQFGFRGLLWMVLVCIYWTSKCLVFGIFNMLYKLSLGSLICCII